MEEDGGAAATRGARVVDYGLDSRRIGEELPVKVVVPRGARDGRRSLLVFLHGRGDDESSYLEPEVYEALAMRTGPGGHESEYWSQSWDRYVRVYARALKECQEPRDRRG